MLRPFKVLGATSLLRCFPNLLIDSAAYAYNYHHYTSYKTTSHSHTPNLHTVQYMDVDNTINTYAIYTPVQFKVLRATTAPMLSESVDQFGQEPNLQHSSNIVVLPSNNCTEHVSAV